MNLEQIAKACHEANRVIQVSNDEEPSPRWDDAPQWQKDSAIEGVKRAQDGETPEQLHESWLSFKRSNGWVYGPVKDADLKTHPCIVRYYDLPDVQKLKEHMFQAIVEALTE